MMLNKGYKRPPRTGIAVGRGIVSKQMRVGPPAVAKVPMPVKTGGRKR